MVSLVQFIIAAIWTLVLVTHTRRLIRLARVEQLRNWESSERSRLRSSWNRIWWWLGQDEFWGQVHIDGLRCVQMTLMLFLMVWGLSI